MRILVAGGAGYIGSRLVPALAEHGYSVDVVDLLWFGNRLPPDTKVTERSLIDCTEKELEGYDQVIFLGGLSNDPMAEYSPAENFVQNGAVPAYLAFIAKRAGVKRLIYASSCSVYGYTLDKLYDEDAPVIAALYMVLTMRSKRMRGLHPLTVPWRRATTEKSPSASCNTARSPCSFEMP